MSSSEQLNRVVGLVAELTKLGRQGSESTPLDELAQRFGTTPGQIQSDIRVLTLMGDDPDVDWLLSLSVSQEGDRVSIRSGGPFQRPIRFTGDEIVAIQLGLADVADGGYGLQPAQLSTDLANVLKAAEQVSHSLAGRGRVSPSLATLVRTAINDRRRLDVKYTSERSLGGINRIIHPYQLLEQEGYAYIVAWCELAGGWRRFRGDRVIDALLADGHYVVRGDFVPAGDSFSEPAEGATPVRVKFSPSIARWLTERYPDALPAEDGSVVVTFQVASPEWLVRHVLQYGPEAEVVGPESYRELMRTQLA